MALGLAAWTDGRPREWNSWREAGRAISVQGGGNVDFIELFFLFFLDSNIYSEKGGGLENDFVHAKLLRLYLLYF